MERHGLIKWTRNASSKEKEWKQHKKLRKGLTLYLILFSYYLLMLILWKDMAKSNGQGKHHRKKKNGNNTRKSYRFDFISKYILKLFINTDIMERHG